ncbi:MAG: HPr-like protein Crh [Verrucomicrobiae bacterium]|nr:HPr-like protein Crh [Verrucomicrobiae bacterium]
MSAKVTKQLTVINKLGIHARPAALFVKVAGKFASDIHVEKDGETINGKSIMGLMMLAAGQGSQLRITAEGRDAEAALKALEDLFQQKFNED